MVTRWGGALPQYTVGHLDRVARIQASLAAQPGLAACGAAYAGVGIPACIGDRAGRGGSGDWRGSGSAARTVRAENRGHGND